MKVKVKKQVLLGLLKKINENKSSRGDTLFNNTTGFFGNYGSVKSNNSPISAKPHMAVQLSIAEPPVDDPEYVPATTQELGIAAVRIAKEVPSKKIEFFYRRLHKLLDAALDEDDENLFSLKEAIDYSNIHPMHKKAIEQAVQQAYEFTKTKWQGEDEVEGLHPDKAALFAVQNRDMKRYNITLVDIVDEIEKLIASESYEENKPAEESLPDEATDAFVKPPATLKDITHEKNKKSKKRVVTRKKGRSIGKTTKEIKPPTDEQLDKQAEEEMMDMLATAYSEHTEMEDLRGTWDWDNYEEEAPYLNVVFKTIKLLHELSYRVLQANYLNKYGGYIYDPDADKGGKKKGGFVLEKRGPTSRPTAVAMIRRINSDFGLHYDNIMRQTNILKMSLDELTTTIERAMIGIFQRIPGMYSEFLQASEGDQDVVSEALGFFASVIAHKYKGEAQNLDRDLVSNTISGIFKRCLLDLPTDLGISTSATISVASMRKKKTSEGDKTFGFNLAGATKRFEKLRKDPKIAKVIKKLMPKLILNKITETKTANVTKKGNKYKFEDKRTGLGYELKAVDLKKKIKDYVDLRLKGSEPTFGEDQEVEAEDIIHDAELAQKEAEKEAQKRLSKDDYEVRKAVFEMEKMVSSGDWMHIAPLFGFSGAPGVRSWYLRYPERKINILVAARSENAPAGATRYLDELRTARENLAGKLLDSNNRPGVLSLMIDEITSKGSLATSDQQMISLLSDMKDDIQELLDLYLRYPSYNELEREEPATLMRLGNTPGGSLLRFSVGAIFDKIIKDIDRDWQIEMQEYLETKNGLNSDKAKQLSYYFTGLKNKPSKGDFSSDKEKLTKVSMEFIDAGIEWPAFNEALRYSQAWLFSTLDRELKKRIETGKLRDNYYKKIHELTGELLYKEGKLNTKFYNKIKNLIAGKNGAISSYLDNLAIEQFQQKVTKNIEKEKSKNPSTFK